MDGQPTGVDQNLTIALKRIQQHYHGWIERDQADYDENCVTPSQGSVVWKNWLITPYWVAKRFWKTRLTATMAKTLGKKMIGLKNFAPRMSFQRTRHASKKEITMRGKVCAAQ